MNGKKLLNFFIGSSLILLGLFWLIAILSFIISDSQNSLRGVVGDFMAEMGLMLLGWISLALPVALLTVGIGIFCKLSTKRWIRLTIGFSFAVFALMLLAAFPFVNMDTAKWELTDLSSGTLGWLITSRLHTKIGWTGLIALTGFCACGSAIFLGGERLVLVLNDYKERLWHKIILLWHSTISLPRKLLQHIQSQYADKAGLRKQKKLEKKRAKSQKKEQKAAAKKTVQKKDNERAPNTAESQSNQRTAAEAPYLNNAETITEAAPAVADTQPNQAQKREPEIVMPEKHIQTELQPDQTFKKAQSGELQQPAQYNLPPLQILHAADDDMSNGEDEDTIRERGEILERTLQEFKIEAEVVRVQRGPVVTMYEMALAPGTKVSKVESLDDDLAIALKAPNVRIVAPIPGKSTIGIEVPNSQRETVTLRELFSENGKEAQHMDIPLFLGKDTAGSSVLVDLAMAPHLLIAGATGAGKSVCINSIICSIIMTRTPEEVQLLLVDPKSVEFADYQAIPHLICPVVTDMKKAANVLQWACKKMDERYSLLARVGVRNIGQYNRLGSEEIINRLDPEEDAEIDDVPFTMAHTVIIIDELGELMLVAAKEVEASIIRLSQKARAVGIHLICATQRPSADVITGLIKANLPVKIAFQVSSKINSRVILDRNGAELLLGRGDMLIIPPGSSRMMRAQGTFVSQAEAVDIVKHVSSQQEPQFKEELQSFNPADDGDRSQEDELYDEAVHIVLETQRGSVSLLQRRLSIGYSRAAKLIDMIAEAGIIGPYKGSQAREVHMTLEEWEAARTQQG